jgi:integrase
MASFVKTRGQIKFRLGRRDCRVTFGPLSDREGKAAVRHIEELLDCLATGLPPNPKTKRWLDCLPDKVHDRISRYGLTPSRKESNTAWIDGFLVWCLHRKKASPTSLQVYEKAAGNLRTYFRGRLIESISRRDVDAFREWLLTKANRRRPGGLAPSTANKRLKTAKEWFELAKDRQWTDINPFDHLKNLDAEAAGPADNQVFVPRSVIDRLLDDAPDTEWKLLLTLWRFAGLRQLEPLALKWPDISWQAGRMTVTAPKQKGRKRLRVIPIWPEVEPWLLAQSEEAPPGTEWVIWRRRYKYDTEPEKRSTGSALYGRLENQLKRLGIPAWPRLTHNLRASGETELEQSGRFRQWEIAYWWNHTKRVQEDHYLMVTDDAYERAKAHHASKRSAPSKRTKS